MEFRTRYNPSVGYVPEKRSYPTVAPLYEQQVDRDTGKTVVVQRGFTNVFALKQEAEKDCLVYNVIDKINRTGDFSLLGENLGGFIDVTDMPRNLLEASCVRVQVSNLFDRLPFEERSKYGNDVSVFVKSVNDKLRQKVTRQRDAVVNGISEVKNEQ